MTLSDFLGVLVSKVQVSVVNNSSDAEIMNVKNAPGIADNLSTDLAASVVKRVEVNGASAITVVVEAA